MALSNTATPKYYGRFREAVLRGDIPVCREIAMEMNRIDELIANPRYYYDDAAIDGFIAFCENELTTTDGSDIRLLDTFKLWAESYLLGSTSSIEVFMNRTIPLCMEDAMCASASSDVLEPSST